MPAGSSKQEQAAGSRQQRGGGRNSNSEKKVHHGVLCGRTWLRNAFGALVACLHGLSSTSLPATSICDTLDCRPSLSAHSLL